MLCMLFNVYISTIRYVLLISSFCRWGKQGTEKPSNLLLVTHQPEKLGFKSVFRKHENNIQISNIMWIFKMYISTSSCNISKFSAFKDKW